MPATTTSNYGVPIVDVIADCQAALEDVAPSYDDERSIPKHDAPGRYIWVLTDADATDKPREIGGNPRALHDDVWRVEVHCWGYDTENPNDAKAHKARALRLRQALITSLRQVVGGGAYRLRRTLHRGGDAHQARGWVVVVEIDIVLPLYEARWVGLGGAVEDNTGAKVRPTSVGFDATSAVQGDRKIHAGET